MGINVHKLKCLRNKKCEPIEQITSDEEPLTFVCAGFNNDDGREIIQDNFCHCFKSVGTNTEFYLDKTDIMDTIAVLSKVLALNNYIELEEE